VAANVDATQHRNHHRHNVPSISLSMRGHNGNRSCMKWRTSLSRGIELAGNPRRHPDDVYR
jgi:hypothetical protein